jgi:hypothetical protein
MMGNADEHDAQRRERLAKVRTGCDVAVEAVVQLALAGIACLGVQVHWHHQRTGWRADKKNPRHSI